MTAEASQPLQSDVGAGGGVDAEGVDAFAAGVAAVDTDGVTGDRNLPTVVDAILDLLEEGVERPGAIDIANRSGISMRAVFRYFEDPEYLYSAAIETHSARIAHLYVPPSVDGTREERAAGLAAQRASLFEAAAPVRRIAERYRGQSAAVEQNMGEMRLLLRHQVTSLFATELATLESDEERRIHIDALDVATGWHSWETLRTELKYPVERAQQVLEHSILALTVPV